MCGLVAVVSAEAPVSMAGVNEALDAISHRGPDGRGTWQSADHLVALGHVRLAVRDLLGGAQPLASEDGAIIAVVNGELYGVRKLRAELEGLGRRFRTSSDSELVVHAWRQWGRAMLGRLEGELAFALWDDRQKLLIAARDRFGVKPLAWTSQRGRLVLASRVSALLAMGVPARWDRASLFQSASFQYAAPDATFFDGVHELAAGHVLVARAGDVRVERYWDLDIPTRHPDVAVGAARIVRKRFDEAVAERVIADVPVAFQLSGGLDSSAVLASAARSSATPLDAFTVSFAGDDAYDEVALARATAAELGARLTVVEITDREIADSFADAVAYAESPCINAHAAAKLHLSRAIRDSGFKVALTGEGADEVLFGYAHLRSDLEETLARVAPTNAASSGLMLPNGPGLSTHEVERTLGFVPTWISAKASFGQRVRPLVRAAFATSFAGDDAGKRLLAPFDIVGQLRGRTRVEQSAYLWTRLALEGYILRALGDGLEMASGVEGRLPFLDTAFYEAVKALPVDWKIRRGVEKWVFREAMRGALPKAILSREKHPFLAPPMGPKVLATLRDAVASRGFDEQPLFEPGAVRDLVGRVPSMTPADRKAYDPVLFYVLSIAALQDKLRMTS